MPLLGIQFIVCLLLNQRRYIGIWNDDALYVLIARSLLEGRYAALELPGHPFLTSPLPGLPLLLAPFVALVRPHWELLKLVPCVLTVLTGWLLISTVKSRLSSRAVRWFSCLLLFNAYILQYSGDIMTESLFFFVAAAIAYALTIEFRSDKKMGAWLGLLTGVESLVRPEGWIFIPAVALGLWRERRWKAFLPFTVIAITLPGLFMFRNWRLAGTLTHYLQFSDSSYTGFRVELFADRLVSGIRMLLIETFLAVPFKIDAILEVVVAGGLLALIAWGYKRAVHPPFPARSRWALSAFATAYFTIHVIWPFKSPRHFMILLPWIIWGVVQALEELHASRHKAAPWAKGLLQTALVASCLIPAGYMLWQVLAKTTPSIYKGIPQTAVEAKAKIPSEAVVMTNMGSAVHLYTNLLTTGPIACAGPLDCSERLHAQDIHYLLLIDRPLDDPRSSAQWIDIVQAVLAPSNRFTMIYENTKERSRIYKTSGG